MNKPNMTYFQDADVIHIAITEDDETESVELSPGMTAELNAQGELIGIEILNASEFLRDYVLESAQLKLLNIMQQKASVTQ